MWPCEHIHVTLWSNVMASPASKLSPDSNTFFLDLYKQSHLDYISKLHYKQSLTKLRVGKEEVSGGAFPLPMQKHKAGKEGCLKSKEKWFVEKIHFR